MKYCVSCERDLEDDKFYTRSIRNKAKSGKVYKYKRLQHICIECMLMSKNIYKPVPKTVKKFCHRCFAWKLIGEYREYRLQGDNRERVHSNHCKGCEDKHGRKYDGFHEDKDSSEGVNDSYNNAYLCAFIGNDSYKDICDVYGIRYEK